MWAVPLLARLRPDLVVTQAQCDVCALPEDAVRRAVAEEPALRGARVLSLNPGSLNEVLDDLVRVGDAAGQPVGATRARDGLRQRIKRLSAAAHAGDRPAVVVVEWLEPPMAASNWTPELVELAGGRPALGVGGRHSEYATWRQIADARPDYLILAPCGFDLARTLDEWRRVPTPGEWGEIPAVRSGCVFAVDGDVHFNRPGPRLVETAELLVAMLAEGNAFQDRPDARRLGGI